MVREHIRYTGRVQGVGFRATARDVARAFAVTGWVRNEPDGSVALEVQGPPDEIAAFRARLRAVMGQNIATEDATHIDPRADDSGFIVAR
jgi:acylphosphatase